MILTIIMKQIYQICLILFTILLLYAMQIIITGGGGFLGQLLAKKLIESTIPFTEMLLVDIQLPAMPIADSRIKCLKSDISEIGVANSLISTKTKIVFHLAAIVSSHAEADFDLGWKVNMEGTKYLLEACRQQNSKIRFVFASSCAVFGGNLPEILVDSTALTPQSSYGAQKAIGELMVNDYSRKGFVDGIALRLPTVCVRPGKPNLAASSFVSSIIREPLNGQQAICPVPAELDVWVTSPETVIKNFIHAATFDVKLLAFQHSINLPGIKISVAQMLNTLAKTAGNQLLELVKFEPDQKIRTIVNTWPTQIDNATAINLGFKVDAHFIDFIDQYLTFNKI